MSLVWKLLRQHMSISQFVGFVLANLFGMLIVLLGFQFYRDVLPVFTAEDSFMKADNLIISKKIGAATTISGRNNAFTLHDIDDLQQQPFVKRVGVFTSAAYQVNVTMGIQGTDILNSEFFFESIPDSFVDVPATQWAYKEGTQVIPMILPRSYIAMYNFGYARTRSLPKISEGVIGMLDVKITIQDNGKKHQFAGKVIGFSNRLNTILVPEAFMKWSNQQFASNAENLPNRVMVEAVTPADKTLKEYLDNHGYEVENSNSSAEKTIYFLRLVVSIVMIVGLIIAVMSFYILILSIYLLVQKNADKLENLLLIGYGLMQVARPYIMLTLFLNAVVLLIAVLLLIIVRSHYMDMLYALHPSLDKSSLAPTCILGVALLVMVCCINGFIISNKMFAIWKVGYDTK